MKAMGKHKLDGSRQDSEKGGIVYEKKFKVFIALLCGCVLILGTTISAFAAQVNSTPKYTGNINGYSYKIVSSLSDAGYFGVCASGSVSNVSGKSPAGWIGINARVMQGTAVRASTGMQYTTSSGGFDVIGAYYNATGTFYSQCQADLYNGNGYTRVTSNRSPNMNWTKSLSVSANEVSNFENSSYAINNSGETYGSIAIADVEGENPDLILAVGVNGVIGYVKDDDLNKTFESPNEAIEWTLDHQDPYTIPLYDCEGDIQIGEFLIEPGDLVSEN